MNRACVRASDETPWLRTLLVDENGGLVPPSPEIEGKISPREAARGGLALVAHLLDLLATFIGEALTLRLVQRIWPKAALDSKISKMKT